MLHVMQGSGIDSKNIHEHLGSYTTFRLLNRKYTTQLLNTKEVDLVEDVKELANDDFVLFWHYFSAPYLDWLQQEYPTTRMYLLAPELINWQLAIFSQLRADFTRMGLGPFECYRFMSSGFHGLLLAVLTCSSVDVYGFSISMDNFEAGFNHGRPSESHSWEFETMLVRLFYFLGAVDVCNT